uniref:Uncharacterized protein n=1 Tax=Knipowitschia caucasica TaxID=637954 RepID=A0AAV2M9X9_KNICA
MDIYREVNYLHRKVISLQHASRDLRTTQEEVQAVRASEEQFLNENEALRSTIRELKKIEASYHQVLRERAHSAKLQENLNLAEKKYSLLLESYNALKEQTAYRCHEQKDIKDMFEGKIDKLNHIIHLNELQGKKLEQKVFKEAEEQSRVVVTDLRQKLVNLENELKNEKSKTTDLETQLMQANCINEKLKNYPIPNLSGLPKTLTDKQLLRENLELRERLRQKWKPKPETTKPPGRPETQLVQCPTPVDAQMDQLSKIKDAQRIPELHSTIRKQSDTIKVLKAELEMCTAQRDRLQKENERIHEKISMKSYCKDRSKHTDTLATARPEKDHVELKIWSRKAPHRETFVTQRDPEQQQ